MNSSESSNFLGLVEEREPIFREVLAAANDLVKEVFQDYLSYAETAISHSRDLLPSPPSGLESPGSTASTNLHLNMVSGRGMRVRGRLWTASSEAKHGHVVIKCCRSIILDVGKWPILTLLKTWWFAMTLYGPLVSLTLRFWLVRPHACALD